MLRGLGYEVIEAANGSDARRLLSENGGRRVDLLLTDLVMPQGSGRRFADSLRAAHPNIKVLLSPAISKNRFNRTIDANRECFSCQSRSIQSNWPSKYAKPSTHNL